MTQDEIIRMALEACAPNQTFNSDEEWVKRFASLVAEHWIETNKSLANEIIELKKQAEQEPVAILEVFSGWSDIADVEILYHAAKKLPDGEYKLYAATVRTKDLTDDEIYTLYSEPCSDREMVEFARAVIAADREKNK